MIKTFLYIFFKQRKQSMKKIYVLLIAMITFAMSTFAQITVTVSGTAVTTPALAASYPDLATAVGALNGITSYTTNGTIVFTCTAGTSETAPATGLTIGSATLNPLLSSTNTVTIIKAGGTVTLNAGAGGTGTPGTAVQNGILNLVGADWITIDGLNFTDGNAANPATMEYGIGLFKLSATDGAQNNTFQNCIITLNRDNNATGTAPSVDGSRGINVVSSLLATQTTVLTPTAASGTNSNNKFYSNTIQNCNIGIALIGFAAVSPFTLADQSNDIGGTVAGTGNTIKNYGGGAAATNPAAGIRTLAQYGLNVSYNTVNSNDGGGINHGSTLRGIYLNTAVSASETITNNTITIKGGGTTSAITAIDNVAGATAAANTVSINNNTITGCTYPLATSGTFTGISNTASAATVNINSNQFTSNATNATSGGTTNMITNSGVATVALNINSNNINGFTFNAAGGAFNGINSSAVIATATQSVSNNNFQAITYATSGASAHIYIAYQSGTNTTCNVNSNTFTNLNVNTTGSVTFINRGTTGSMTATGSESCSSNSIVTGFNKGSAGGTVTFFTNGGGGSSVAGSTHLVNLNNFSNVTCTGATAIVFWNNADGSTTVGAQPVKTITNNTFNNITTGAAQITGISWNFATGASSVSNNTLTNLTGGGVILALSSGTSNNGTHTINNNTLTNFTTLGQVNVIQMGAHTPAITNNISNNTIRAISTSGAANAIFGIIATGGLAANTTNIFKNKIGDITSNFAGASTVTGVLVQTLGTYNIYNNLIGDLKTPTSTSLNAIQGISVGAGVTANAYFNSIYLNATSSSATTFGTSCIGFSSTATSFNSRNNILYNSSIPAQEGLNVATNGVSAGLRRTAGTAAVVPTNYATTSNNNAYWVNHTAGTNNHLSYVEGTATITNPQNTLANMKAFMANRDQVSIQENVTFLGVVAANATFLHIDPTIATQVESGAGTIAGITDDFDGDVRNVTTPDIGADEGTFILADVTGPTITYTPLAFTCDGTVNRTLNTTITDASGVPTSGAGLPVLYWRINAGAWNAATATSGGGSAYSFSFGIGAVVTDVVQYYIVAQDNAGTPNVSASPGGGASGFSINPPAASTPPTTPSSYTINATLNGTYTVGGGGAYPTLTAAINAYNTSCLSGPVIFSLIDPTYTTTSDTIRVNSDASATNTLTIKPTVASTITGNSAAATLVILGGDYITIDGSIGATANTVCPPSAATRDLTISNTNAGTSSAVIWLATNLGDGTTNNRVINCNLTGSGAAVTLFGIGSGSATISTTSLGTGNNNNNFINNSISAVQYGIYAQGASIANKNTGTVINQNVINTNINIGCIYIGFDNGININANNLAVLTGTADRFAISAGFGNSFGATTTVANEVSNATITKNIVGNVAGNSTNSAIGIGLGAATSGTSLIANNMVSGVSSNGTAGDFAAGIAVGGGVGSVTNVYYNTVSMQGTIGGATAATQTSTCFASTNSTAPTLDLRNNIFSNTQVGNTGASVRFSTIAMAYSTFATLTSDYNDLYCAGAGPGTYQIGITGTVVGGTNSTTLANWQTTTTKDAASKNVLPVFISPTNLHLVTTNPSNNTNLNTGGTPISITDDIDCEVRDAATPDIGADEYIVAACAGSAGGTATLTNASVCSGSATTVTATGYETIGTGLSYQWEVSIDNFVTDINDLTGQTNPATANTGNRTVTTYFRLRVICSTGPSTGYSNIVTLTINPKPTAGTTPSGTTSICAPATQLYTATTDIGDTYQWKLNGVNIGGANAATYTAAASGSYQVVVTNSGTGCKDSSAAAILVVNAQPTAPTITPASATFCLGASSVLVASGSTVPATILSENFNGVTAGTTTSGNLPAGWSGSSLTAGVRLWGVVANAQAGSTIGGGNFLYVESDLYTTFQTQSEVITPAFDASNYSSVNIKFKQYYNDLTSGAATDSAKVYVSNNGGATWVLQQQYDADQGTAFTGAGAVSTTIALNAVPLTNNMKVKLYYASDAGGNDWYWAIDDFVLDGLQNVTYTWSPTAGLYTDAALTTAYTGTPLATVYASPAATQSYTVTATGPAPSSCTNNTVTASITVTPPTSPNGLAAVSGGAQVCASAVVSAAGTKFFNGTCDLISKLTPNGGSPVSGTVNTCVKIDAAVGTYNGAPYLQRHFDIEPATAPGTSTARVTLYVLQAEFDAYNLANGAYGDLPVAPGDASGIGNLLVTQYHGTSATSDPGTYSGAAELINPADIDIVWNATSNWWEISFDVTGFSGFFVHTGIGPLPISVNYLRGAKQGSVHNLNWKVTCTSSPTATMILERSGDNRTFTAINSVTADQLRCAQPFDYADVSPLAGINYYRLKIIDANGKVTYSNTIAMVNTKTGVTIVGIVPNPVTSTGNAVLNVASAQKGMLRLVVTDVTGRQVAVQSEAIIAGSNQIAMNVAKLAAGSYQVTAITDDGNKTSVRFVKQ
jgi:hypothetical protein